MQTVSDIMHGIITIGEYETIRAAAIKMIKNHRGSVIIIDSLGNTLGILTERDMMRFVSEGIDFQKTRIHGYFSANIITADENTSLEEASKIMDKHSIRRLPVTKNDKIIGVLTTRDLSKSMRFDMAEKFLSDSFRPGIHSEMNGRNYR